MCQLLAELDPLVNKSDQEFPPEKEAIKELFGHSSNTNQGDVILSYIKGSVRSELVF
jgi:hypothetical protein